MADEDFGLDEYGDLALDETGDAGLVADNDALEQDLAHRVMTIKGDNPADATYGGNLPLYLHAENTRSTRKALVLGLQNELAKDGRILPQRTDIRLTRLSAAQARVAIGYVRSGTGTAGQTEATV